MGAITLGFNPAVNQTVREMQNNNQALNKALTQLTTGNRINHAGDDAAGYTIGSNMHNKVRGMQRAIRNANDAISAFQVLGGSLKGLTTRVARLQELAIQAQSSFNNIGDITNINQEVKTLLRGINSEAQQSHFNGINLMQQAREFSVQIGDSANDTLTLEVQSMTTQSLKLEDIEFALFSEADRYYDQQVLRGVEIAGNHRTSVDPLLSDNATPLHDIDISAGWPGPRGTYDSSTGFDILIFNALPAMSGELISLEQHSGQVVTDKIAIKHSSGSAYIMLNLATSVDNVGVTQVAITSLGIIDGATFNAQYHHAGAINSVGDLGRLIEPEVQRYVDTLPIADSHIKLLPSRIFPHQTLPAGASFRRLVNAEGQVEANTLLMVVKDPHTAEIKLYDVEVNSVMILPGSQRDVQLRVIGEHADKLTEYAPKNSADSWLVRLKQAYDHINEVSSSVGATITGLHQNIESLSTNIANTADAHARIVKADILETYSSASRYKIQQQAIAQAMQMANSLTEIALQAMR